MTDVQKSLIVCSLVVIAGVTWWLVSPLWRNIELHEELPQVERSITSAPQVNTTTSVTAPMVLARAPLVAGEHAVAGSAAFVQAEGKVFLRFEDLDTVNGPDLRIYLATDSTAKDSIDLGPIRATKGSVNYEIPEGTDLTKYTHALIWCRAFSVLFSYARLY